MELDNVVKVYKSLADKTRFRILVLLKYGELCVCDIEAALNMSQPRISQHLLKLKNAGLIEDRQVGKWKHYSLSKIGLDFMNKSSIEIIKSLKNSLVIKKDLKNLKKYKKIKSC